MLRPAATRQFARDRRRAKQRRQDLAKLDAIMARLAREARLDTRYRVHKLGGEYHGYWECHLGPDWLLIWYTTSTEIVFVRTGTHADLFG
ncbi:MAG: type II toxin-antitoxin system YafQ family toxin [Gemmatimonadetes bacterium]|nr:type II toxin-antitoxin system YafQ family toxin [Gemmatimonadota bacterium]